MSKVLEGRPERKSVSTSMTRDRRLDVLENELTLAKELIYLLLYHSSTEVNQTADQIIEHIRRDK